MAGILKQTALNITRSGNVMTMTWKLADFYDTQETYWSVEGNTVITPLLGTDTSVSYTIPVAKYFPNTENKLASVVIGVRGVINGKAGSWATATYKFVAPKKPTVSKATLKFLWDTDQEYVAGRGDPYVTDIVYQRVNSTSAVQKQVIWGTGASSSDFTEVTGESASGEVSYTESDKVEWFRCCSRGFMGQSAWEYASHVNAPPYAPTALESKVANKNVMLTWVTQATAEHPIDYQKIQYCYAKPLTETDRGVPVCPEGVTWLTGADHILPTAMQQAFPITQFPPADYCLFIRVCTVCESYTSPSEPIFAMGGPLVNPTLVSIASDPITKQSVVSFTNNSTLALSKIAILTSKNKTLAIVPNGGTTATVNFVPNNNNLLGLKAFQGLTAVKPNMRSDNVFTTAGDVPLAPTNVAVIPTEKDGTVEVSWDIPWTDASGAEISWADHEDAWYSTDGPKTYEIDQRTTQWNVAGLISGVIYYFQVRLKDSAGVYGPYSETVTVSFASAPGKPTLTSSAVAVQPGESFQLAWTYETSDTTDQAQAIIYDGGIELARVESNAQRMSVTPAWLYGTSHTLTVQTVSKSGFISEMSDPVVITVAERPTISPIASAITSGITDGVLTDLPIVMEVTGAGDGGQTTIKIERLKDYFVDRPDGSVTDGYGGETIFAVSYAGEGELSIGPGDLVGAFDDGGEYRLTAIVQDSVGQKAEAFLDFVVEWDHQAETPTATVTVDASNLSAKIKAIAPASYEAGDTVDIYRLSADKPELIVKGGEFGTFYVDPYPASNGGYRFVDITVNGDYANATGIAWIDVPCNLAIDEAVINFNGERISLPYNIDLQNTWDKDFEETKYLNGHVVGDWNRAVSKTVSLNAVLPRDDERTATVRDLAVWPGICHVRTPDGSSYSADVQVAESTGYSTKMISYTFNITRVDPEGTEVIDEANT